MEAFHRQNCIIKSAIPSIIFQHFCLFHNAEVQTQELGILDMKSFIFISGMPHSATA